jgi:hypothetical protein
MTARTGIFSVRLTPGEVDTLSDWVAGARLIRPDGTFADRKLRGTQLDFDDARRCGLQAMQRRAKHRNGCLLDGREHLDHPTEPAPAPSAT